MFRPEIADRAGRGALCEQIEAVAKDMTAMAYGKDDERPDFDRHEFNRLKHRLDGLRERFHTLYGRKVSNG